MKRFFKNGIYAFIAALLLFAAMPVSAQAAQVILAVSGGDIKVGDTFTVSMTAPSSSKLSLHYDGTMVTPVSMNGAALDGNTLSISARSISFTFEAKASGGAGFVASSDSYDRSSVVVDIAKAAETAENTENVENTDNTEKSETVETTETDKTTKKDDTDTSQKKTKKTAAAVKPTQDTAPIIYSSESLSFRELITDRRMVLVTGILLAIIIVLIIRITVLKSSSDDTGYDYAEEEEENEVPDIRINEDDKIKPEVPEIDEEKLTMPKPPKKPAGKLRLEDLNDI